MEARRYVVMGAGEVGFHLARILSSDGQTVTLIDRDPAKARSVEEQLDVRFVLGNGCQVPVLKEAGVGDADLFIAVSSSDEANLAGSLLAKNLGVPRTVVRVTRSEDVTLHGRLYERAFQVDLLLSTQLLTTMHILNRVLAFNTLGIEYLAGGAVQVRRTAIGTGSILAERRLADAELPADCLVLAFVSNGRVSVPTGNDRARVGDDALVIGTPQAIHEFERRMSPRSHRVGLAVVAGGGATAKAVVQELEGQAERIKVLESDRQRAEELAAEMPNLDIIHGDATDPSVLAAEGVGEANAFLALTGNDETNLMACLVAQDLGARHLTALVQRSDTTTLWRKLGLLDVVSPRTTAAERIRNYIDHDHDPHIVSFEHGAAQFMHRQVHAQSPAAGSQLRDLEVPQGLIVAAVLRDGTARVPRGKDRLEVGDNVVLFVRQQEAETAHLLFPGCDAE